MKEYGNENNIFTDAAEIIGLFDIEGEITDIRLNGKGYINRTFLVQTENESGETKKYILQRVNDNVFKDIDTLMKNYSLLNERLSGFKLYCRNGSENCGIPKLIPCRDGKNKHVRMHGGFWRMLNYFDNVYSVNIPQNTELFYNAGRAFGDFLNAVSVIPVSEMGEVIHNFHNTHSRYLDLEKAISDDVCGRAAGVSAEIEFVRERKDKFSVISDALESGEIPKRITHNDTNLNNILFDNDTSLPVAIIDLDTVMPSSPLYDFGDSIRIGSNSAEDDEKDLSKVSCDLSMFEAYARGWLEKVFPILTEKEIELLPYAAPTISMEDGIRFLADYIGGDTYYKTDYPGQNLDRCRTQFALARDMEIKSGEMESILNKIVSGLKEKS